MSGENAATATAPGRLAAPADGYGNAMLPSPYRVTDRTAETADSVTLRLAPAAEPLPPFRPGQFTMLCRPGIGEVAISVSGDPAAGDGSLTQTIRDVGAVSGALCRARPGDLVGVRGPFGTCWDLDPARGDDLLIVAGGVGLAPLRPVLLSALARRADYRRVTLIAGARAPDEFLFRGQHSDWAAMPGLAVELTIDRAAADWVRTVGFVTEPLRRLDLDPARTNAFLCGPEIMMRLCARMLLSQGLAASRIQVSLERNMKCGVGLCGHCQLGPLLLCRDGPVISWAQAESLLAVREL
jgi:NAD(P)H-flavin reductase